MIYVIALIIYSALKQSFLLFRNVSTLYLQQLPVQYTIVNMDSLCRIYYNIASFDCIRKQAMVNSKNQENTEVTSWENESQNYGISAA